ncbi:galanin receptor 2a-like [Amphiura filiformis]|uniref:galanin receptor 2a-like n=1 Tax=Amphiura filiformis TaxID=82378 RepID=UPI003B21E2B5
MYDCLKLLQLSRYQAMESSNLNESTVENATVPNVYLVPVPWYWRQIFQLILAIVGIIGNSVVIHLYLNTRKLAMSATNRFIAALAVADIITSICIIPIPTLSHVPANTGGRFYCKVVWSSFVMWVSIIASILTLTVLSVERFVAIAQPVRYKRLFSVKMTRLIIGIIWIFAFVFNTFVIYVNHLTLDNNDLVRENNDTCYVDYYKTGFQIFIGISVFIVEYLIPVTLMLVTNIRSIQLLKTRAQVLTTNSDNALLQARRRIIYMLLYVIISFIICWSPDQIAFLIYNLGIVPPEYIYGYTYRAFVVLAFSNSCVNPVLYAMTNKNFRRAIKQHLFHSRRGGGQRNSFFDTPFETGELSGSKTSTDGTNNLSTINIVSALPPKSNRQFTMFNIGFTNNIEPGKE